MNNPYKYNYLNNDVKDNFSGCKLPLVNIRQGSIHYIDNVIRIAVINTNFAIGYRNDGNSL